MTSTDARAAGADPQNGRQQVLTDVWHSGDRDGLETDHSNAKVCRNARHFSFDGFGDGNDDVATSWRKLLEREGKVSEGSTSLRDLVMGPTPTD